MKLSPNTYTKWLPIFSLLFLYTSIIQAQTYIPSKWNQVEVVDMPKMDNELLRQREVKRRQNKEVPEFAISHKVYMTPNSAGKWQTNQHLGIAIWQLRIRSTAAYSLNFGFTDFFMPEGGELYLYSVKDGSQRGPFTPADNEVHAQLWTPIVNGDDVLIEVRLPTKNRDELRLTLSSVNHDFTNFESLLAQSCNIDTNCGALEGYPQIDNYRDVIKSVSMYSIRGTRACTGFLVNNTRQDCTPYYMTADHCGINANNAASIVAYWNYENTTCRPPNTSQNGRIGDGRLEQFNTGAILRANRPASDMTLLELDDPIADSVDVFFAGWNTTRTLPDSAVCIHHPSTEEKRISFTYQPILRGTTGGDASSNGQYMIVQDWDIGSTEVGSSGSPLFNTEGEVIGQLFGGQASCSNDRYDAYGSFAESWSNGNTASTRLANWLDRDGFGLERLAGRQQGACGEQLRAVASTLEVCTSDTARFELVNENGFSEQIVWSIEGLPEGWVASIQVNEENDQQAILFITGLENSPASNTVFSIVIDELETFLKLTILPTDLAAPNILSPADGNPAVSNNPFLEWEALPFDPNYELQIHSDSIFDEVAISELSTNNLQVNGLEAGVTYYWRVRAVQECGLSEWSPTVRFTTAFCEIVDSENVPIAISSGSPNDYRSVLNLEESGTIVDLNISTLRGVHTWIEDLQIVLESPEGTRVTLLDEPCFSDENFDLQLDDESSLVELKCPPDDGRIYRPAEALAAFRGEEMQGQWTLRIRDTQFQDGGELQAWGIEVCQASQQFDVGVTFPQDRVVSCGVAVDSIQFQIGDNFEEETLMISLEGNIADELSYDIARAPNETTGYIIFDQLDLLSSGNYVLELRVEDQYFSVQEPFVLAKIPVAEIKLIAPQDRSEAVMLANTILEWEGVSDEYNIQLSETATFDELIYQKTVEGNFTSLLVPDSLGSDQVYFWRVTARTECGDQVSTVFQFRTEKVVSTSSILQDDSQLFPNPSNGLVQLNVPAKRHTMNLYNAKGQLLETREIRGHTQLDFSAYPAGIYQLKLQDAKGMSVHKLILY